jgi:chemotaxis protein CheD
MSLPPLATDLPQLGNYYQESKHYIDKQTGHRVIKLFSGDWHVSTYPDEMIVTILGSCISACIRDPFLKIGGMNHFLLPIDKGSSNEHSARYGAYAMEVLINELLKRGALKSRLEVKLFGGGNVIESSAMIGDQNVQFAKEFVEKENLHLVACHLGGKFPRRIHYYPETGKVMMKLIEKQDDNEAIARHEQQFAQVLKQKPTEGDVELF